MVGIRISADNVWGSWEATVPNLNYLCEINTEHRRDCGNLAKLCK